MEGKTMSGTTIDSRYPWYLNVRDYAIVIADGSAWCALVKWLL